MNVKIDWYAVKESITHPSGATRYAVYCGGVKRGHHFALSYDDAIYKAQNS